MALDRITVTYGRKLTYDIDHEKDGTKLEGSIEFDIPQGLEWQDEYNKAYAILRYTVDNLFDNQPLPAKADVVSSKTATLPGEKIKPNLKQLPIEEDAQVRRPDDEYAVYDESARTSDIDPAKPVRFTNCRVFNVEVLKGKTGPWAKVRIGNREQIPGQYINAKSFQPEIVQKLRALEERDMIDVWGKFDPWRGNEERDEPKYDLMVEGVVRH